MTADVTYVVAGCRPWAREAFDAVLAPQPGRWVYIGSQDELTPDRLAALNPRYVFFLHWSWKVPSAILNAHECVCFHMTDVPYGRGGSPLQHLILAGHRETKVSALRMVEAFDAGPVYVKAPMDLAGTAQEIYTRACRVAAELALVIIRDAPVPVPQTGDVVVFRRRTPADSEIPVGANPERVYDFIRMLDAEGYPHAFIERDGLRYEFRRAARDGEVVQATVRITRIEKESR